MATYLKSTNIKGYWNLFACICGVCVCVCDKPMKQIFYINENRIMQFIQLVLKSFNPTPLPVVSHNMFYSAQVGLKIKPENVCLLYIEKTLQDNYCLVTLKLNLYLCQFFIKMGSLVIIHDFKKGLFLVIF